MSIGMEEKKSTKVSKIGGSHKLMCCRWIEIERLEAAKCGIERRSL